MWVLSFIEPGFAWNVPWVSLIFLKRSLVFPILLFSSISLHWLLRKAFLSLLAILWNSAFKWVYLSISTLLSTSLYTAICKASSDSHFAFLHFFFWGWSWFLSPVHWIEHIIWLDVATMVLRFQLLTTNWEICNKAIWDTESTITWELRKAPVVL